jgi:hypothetical protein
LATILSANHRVGVMNGQTIRPSRHWYWLVAGLGAVMVLLIGLAVVRLISLNQQINSFQRVQVPGRGTLTFTSPGQYLVYFEGPEFGVASPSSTGSVPVLLQSQATGRPVRISALQKQLDFYNVGARRGTAEGSFTIGAPGRYTLRAGPPTGSAVQDIAVGRAIVGSLIAAVVETIIGVLALIAGVVVAVVIAARRGRYRRRLRRADLPPGMWPYPGPGPAERAAGS